MANATFEDHPTDPDKVILRKKPRIDHEVRMTEREALKLAQMALSNKRASNETIYKALNAINEVLAQPSGSVEQEPVGRFDKELNNVKWRDGLRNCDLADQQPLYTIPPQRKPLTDEQIDATIRQPHGGADPQEWARNFARAIEAAHGIKEKNT